MQPDLQELFDAPILEQVELDPGFADHGSSVFRVRIADEHVVARLFRAAQASGPFWGSLRGLFATDPLAASEAVAGYGLLWQISPIPRRPSGGCDPSAVERGSSSSSCPGPRWRGSTTCPTTASEGSRRCRRRQTACGERTRCAPRASDCAPAPGTSQTL